MLTKPLKLERHVGGEHNSVAAPDIANPGRFESA